MRSVSSHKSPTFSPSVMVREVVTRYEGVPILSYSDCLLVEVKCRFRPDVEANRIILQFVVQSSLGVLRIALTTAFFFIFWPFTVVVMLLRTKGTP